VSEAAQPARAGAPVEALIASKAMSIQRESEAFVTQNRGPTPSRGSKAATAACGNGRNRACPGDVLPGFGAHRPRPPLAHADAMALRADFSGFRNDFDSWEHSPNLSAPGLQAREFLWQN